MNGNVNVPGVSYPEFKNHKHKASDVGLGNVPNVTTDDQTPTYTEAATLAGLISGEKLSTAFGKLAKAVADLIAHLSSKSNPHGVDTEQIGAAKSEHTHSTTDIKGTLPIANGGTGATTAAEAMANMGGVHVRSRADVGTSPDFDNPGFNGLFEIRSSAETTGETGTKPFDSFGAFLSMKTPDNIAMMQIAGNQISGYYIRAKQAVDVTMEGESWKRLLTNVLSADDFGPELPEAGTAGRIYFKKV